MNVGDKIRLNDRAHSFHHTWREKPGVIVSLKPHDGTLQGSNNEITIALDHPEAGVDKTFVVGVKKAWVTVTEPAKVDPVAEFKKALAKFRRAGYTVEVVVTKTETFAL